VSLPGSTSTVPPSAVPGPTTSRASSSNVRLINAAVDLRVGFTALPPQPLGSARSRPERGALRRRALRPRPIRRETGQPPVDPEYQRSATRWVRNRQVVRIRGPRPASRWRANARASCNSCANTATTSRSLDGISTVGAPGFARRTGIPRSVRLRSQVPNYRPSTNASGRYMRTMCAFMR
jgi:hypothetical protein